MTDHWLARMRLSTRPLTASTVERGGSSAVGSIGSSGTTTMHGGVCAFTLFSSSSLGTDTTKATRSACSRNSAPHRLAMPDGRSSQRIEVGRAAEKAKPVASSEARTTTARGRRTWSAIRQSEAMRTPPMPSRTRSFAQSPR